MDPADKRFLSLAIALSRRGLGRTWPNPAVGCVLVRDGRIVGRGATQPSGRPHAEQQALARAGAAARGATAYVSLEPCAHYGKTPPCAEALVTAGVVRVVAALQDPDPRVDGQGFDILRAAGVEVDSGLMQDEAAEVLGGFLSRHEKGRPQITLKLALSLDGRIATASGHSQWITGPSARRTVHALRARHDAVMVGAGTARADDPMLTIRDLGISHQPDRIVVSRRLDLPLSSNLARTARDVPVWLCCGPDADPALVSAWQGL
ncbi:MAG: bifunctional diaminohydroxyphosphoribosylaminopyrimidine deaminase/5-amino-6-(5-phosphoribosylamino)uracil reductase RibD, partial [Pseudomonadota bacterium]